MRFVREYVGGFVAAFVLYPGFASVASISLYLSGWPHRQGGGLLFFLGALLGVVACLVLALACRRYATADGANPAAYDALCEAYLELKCRVEAVSADPSTQCHASYVEEQLGLVPGTKPGVGLPWLLSTGYPGLWNRLHRIEEALIAVAPPEMLLEGAIRDELRIDGSRIAHSNELLEKLRRAVDVLVPGGVAFLNKPPSTPTVPPNTAAPAKATPEAARGVLRAIKNTIDEFRDGRREGIVRARNNLFGAVIFAGLVSYVLVGVALVENAGKTQIVAGAVFYLTGAAVGLFKQLRSASAADIVIEEDYGLATARLIHTPLFSGLAAVGGVVLAALLGPIVPGPTGAGSTTVPTAPAATTTPGTTTVGAPGPARLAALVTSTTPAPTPTPTGTTRKGVASLDVIFDLGRNTYGLVFAAVFGLTPNLLIIRLQRQAEQYKADLKSSEAGEQATPAAPA